MKHKGNSMKESTPKPNEIWYIHSEASKHMTSHEELFSYLEKPTQPGVVETGDDTSHSIEHVGDVTQSHVRQKRRLMNLLHVSTITKNLESVGQIIDQGIQVRFTLGASSKKKARSSRKGVEKGGCSSSTRMTLATHYFPKDRRSNRTSSCGISRSATSTIIGLKNCKRNKLCSVCRNSLT